MTVRTPCKTLIAVACAGLLGGCGWVATGTGQPIHVDTPEAKGALCELRSPKGEWRVVTPGAVYVQKTKHKLTATCSKEGYRTKTVEIGANLEPWAIGNVFLGGFIGLSVDWSTGAMHEYPDAYTIHMEEKA
ncbi:MAG: hypothetical protein ACLFWF_13205 [Alphaproteobacteria bacterium]